MSRKSRRSGGEGWSFRAAGAGEAEANGVASLPPAEQRVRVVLEKRGKGKVVTRVSDLVLARDDREALVRALKSLCASGGSVGESAVEVQGDHRERVRAYLVGQGYRVRS